jgi:hypothetical protein
VRWEIRQPDLDERAHRLLEPGLAGHLERLLPALARLGEVDSLFETVVTGHEQFLDPVTRVVVSLHKATLTRQSGLSRVGDRWPVFACS